MTAHSLVAILSAIIHTKHVSGWLLKAKTGLAILPIALSHPVRPNALVVSFNCLLEEKGGDLVGCGLVCGLGLG